MSLSRLARFPDRILMGLIPGYRSPHILEALRQGRRTLRALRHRREARRRFRAFARGCAETHLRLLREKRDQPRLRVVFLAMQVSTWKADPLFRKLQSDPGFEVWVMVIPFTRQPRAPMIEEFEAAIRFFRAKGYDVAHSLGEAVEGRRVLDDLRPDLVFVNNPHNVTLQEFHEDIFRKYLCCYIPYQHQVGQYDNYKPEYNQISHNSMWRIFLVHDEGAALARKHSDNRGANVVVTGYPACEDLRHPPGPPAAVWKTVTAEPERQLLRIIWAPHHSIDMPNLPYATFLRNAEAFRDLVARHRDRVQWAFKPHPLLLKKLYEHPDWGETRAREYYAFWRDDPNCQIETGSYADLFLTSDAMIHDSGSFLAEYHYVNKPVLYLQGVGNLQDYFNDFGRAAFAACAQARDWSAVERFVAALLDGEDPGAAQRREFRERRIDPLFARLPSDRIIDEIRRHFPALTPAAKVTDRPRALAAQDR